MKKLFLCLAALSVTAVQICAEIQPAEKLLPADTLAMLAVPDYTKLREVYSHSPQSQLWRDPAMKAFVDKFAEKLNKEFVAPLEKDLGASLTNYLPLLQGQLTLAFVQNGWLGGKEAAQPGWVFLLDTKSQSTQLKTNLTELKRKWTDASKISRTEIIRGVEFTVLRLATNDLPATLQKYLPDSPLPTAAPDSEKAGDKTDATIEVFIGQSDSLLLAGNQTNVLEKILSAQSGSGVPTLGEQAAFEANRLALFRDAPFYGWINARGIIDLINKQLARKAGEQADKPSFMPFKPEKVIGALGLDVLKSIAFSIHVSDEGSLGEVFFTAPESGRRGLLNLIAGTSKETLPPAFVPADTTKFQRIRFDGQKTWDNLEKTLGSLSPQLIAGLNFAIEMAGGTAKEKNPDYDLKKSLLASLGDDVIIYEKAPRSGSFADLAAPPGITLIGSTKPDQFIEAVKCLITGMNQRGQALKDREFLGRKIYSMELPALRTADGKSGPARALNFSAGNGYLAISTDATLLEEFLRSGEHPGKPLRETAGLAEAAQKVAGSQTTWFNYENQAETVRAFLAAMKQNFGGEKAKNAGTNSNDNFGLTGQQKFFKEWADASLLPDFDKIAKYFYLNVGAGSATPEGISFKVFSPTPPQLKSGGGSQK